MATIYEATSGALTAQPGRSVTTFPSGLIRVDQTYICATANAATHRATLAVGAVMPDGNAEPAMDGLAIHPEPQEVNRGDGFTEFRVSAYGRTKQELSGIQLLQVIRAGDAEVPPSDAPTFIPIYGTFFDVTGFIAVPFGYALTIDDFTFDASLSDPIGFSQRVFGSPLEFSKINDLNFSVDGTTAGTVTVELGSNYFEIKSYQNFGSFVEVCVTVSRGIATNTTA